MKFKNYVILVELLVIMLLSEPLLAGATRVVFDDNGSNTKIPYRIAESKYISFKALDKPPSKYSAAELLALPMNIRKKIVVVVPPNISEEQLKALLKHVVQEETKKNSDIDEVVVFAHGSEADVGGILLYTLGRLEWCPNGVWGNVTSDIAAKNDRTSYQYVFHIRDEVKNLPPANAFKNKEGDAASKDSPTNVFKNKEEDVPTKEEFAIYDAYTKELSANANANADSDEKIIKQKIADKFSISEKKLNDIWLKIEVYQMKQEFNKQPRP